MYIYANEYEFVFTLILSAPTENERLVGLQLLSSQSSAHPIALVTYPLSSNNGDRDS